MIGVTSFSQEGYEKYGKHFLKFVDNFPGKIIVYLEAPIDFEHPNVEKRNFFNIPGVTGFLSNIKRVPMAHGRVEGGGYNYNFDVWKFCRKMFCQYDAFSEGGKIFWLDADLEIFKKIPEDFLEDLFDGQHLVFLGREGFYTESGIIGFDTEHKDFSRFERMYKSVLQTGKVFTLRGWHDCYCFDWAREGKGKSLSDFWEKGFDLDVLPATPLAKYMIHRKGNLKNEIPDTESHNEEA